MNAYLNANNENENDICFDIHNTHKRPSERVFVIDKKLT